MRGSHQVIMSPLLFLLQTGSLKSLLIATTRVSGFSRLSLGFCKVVSVDNVEISLSVTI